MKLRNVLFSGDYTDFVAEFELPAKEAIERMRQWHFDNLLCYPETVEFIKKLSSQGQTAFYHEQ